MPSAMNSAITMLRTRNGGSFQNERVEMPGSKLAGEAEKLDIC